jgi:hypothetical protein
MPLPLRQSPDSDLLFELPFIKPSILSHDIEEALNLVAASSKYSSGLPTFF